MEYDLRVCMRAFPKDIKVYTTESHALVSFTLGSPPPFEMADVVPMPFGKHLLKMF